MGLTGVLGEVTGQRLGGESGLWKALSKGPREGWEGNERGEKSNLRTAGSSGLEQGYARPKDA